MIIYIAYYIQNKLLIINFTNIVVRSPVTIPYGECLKKFCGRMEILNYKYVYFLSLTYFLFFFFLYAVINDFLPKIVFY